MNDSYVFFFFFFSVLKVEMVISHRNGRASKRLHLVNIVRKKITSQRYGLGSPVQERHVCVGMDPGKGHENDEGVEHLSCES